MFVYISNTICSFVVNYINLCKLVYRSLKDSRPAATDKRRFARQRGLLLEKLEDFRRLNKSVRQKLRQLQDSEVGVPLLQLLFKQQQQYCNSQ